MRKRKEREKRERKYEKEKEKENARERDQVCGHFGLKRFACLAVASRPTDSAVMNARHDKPYVRDARVLLWWVPVVRQVVRRDFQVLL